MTADENRKLRDRARWCVAQADAIERGLPPRRDSDAKTMEEIGVTWLRWMASNIAESLHE